MPFPVISCLTSGRISGVDIFAVHLTEGLRLRGHDARILLTNPDRDELDKLPLPTHVPIDTLPESSRRKRRHRRRAIREYLIERSPCFYLPNYDYDHSPIVAQLPPSVRTVGILHSDDPMHYDHLRVLSSFWDGIVCVSEAIGQTARGLGALGDRLRVIPYGVPCSEDFPRTNPSNGILRILYVGRMEQSQKRVMDMIRVMDHLTRMNVEFEWTMAGDGPARKELECQAISHLQSGRLRCLGTKTNDEMPMLYRSADVFVLTSAFEGLPVSMLEAMAQGCVPVVTRVRSGVGDLIQPNKNGYLLEVGDIEGFATTLADLAVDRPNLARLSHAAHATIASGGHRMDAMVDRYADFFQWISDESDFRRPSPLFGELAYRRWRCRVRRNMDRIRKAIFHDPRR